MTSYPKIWFLRHGETHWNVERRIQGQLESELTEAGIAHAHAQARLMQPVLEQNPPCFVSPLKRAQQTAQIALGGRAYQNDARLSEAFAGAWQGMLRDDVDRQFSHLVTPDTPSLDVFLIAPGGEGFDAFEARTRAFLDGLTGPSVVVAHGLLGQVLRGILCRLDRVAMGRLSNEQGCIYVLENGNETVLR